MLNIGPITLNILGISLLSLILKSFKLKLVLLGFFKVVLSLWSNFKNNSKKKNIIIKINKLKS